MKKIISILLLAAIALTTIFTGCTKTENTDEKEIIKTAIKLVEEKYDVKIDEKKYSFSAGKQISENKFVEISSKEKAEEGFKDIVSVSAIANSEVKESELTSFSVTFNSTTNEILNISNGEETE